MILDNYVFVITLLILYKKEREMGTIDYGKVYIVGAGPGDPELLTLKADRLLAEADIIFYDYLVSSDILKRYGAEKQFVGKKSGHHSKTQDQINSLLIASAQQGKVVVRLKGGDPFIFGRGGEEALALLKARVGIDIIPGISSAQAAAAISFSPLTHRHVSASVAFCTGHPLSKIQVPDADTLVYYMAGLSLEPVVSKIMKSGRLSDLPVSLVYNASKKNQFVLETTLGNVLSESLTTTDPMIMIIGKSAGLIESS
jgi:uroporphyrin-III C-methyltransferase